MAPQQSKLKIAVLVVPPVQLLDMSPVDLFFMLSKSYLRDCQLPQAIVDRGLDDVEILYVADEQSCTTLETTTTATTATTITTTSTTTAATASSAEPTRLAGITACLNIQITHTLTSPAVAPGQIDIVLVPGPDPGVSVSEPVKQFLRQHAKVASTHVLSICTGIFVLAQSGVLDGKTCTGPRPLLGMRLRKEFPRANWVEKRWAVDDTETLWTAAGITNGQDMVAAYLRHRFSPELADLVCGFADVGYRKQEYENTNASEGAWFVWIMARSFFKRLVGVSVRGGGSGDGQRTTDSTQQSKSVQSSVS